jgi:hypothetical protein
MAGLDMGHPRVVLRRIHETKDRHKAQQILYENQNPW